MIYAEKTFPRGGTIVKSEAPVNDKQKNITFGGVVRKPKKLQNVKRSGNLFDDNEEGFESISADLLTYDNIQIGMNVMAIVQKIDPLYLQVSLPGGIIARVSALDVSESYTKAMREFLEEQKTLKTYKPLDVLYQIGNTVYGRVMEIKQENSYKMIKFSLKPSDVHIDLIHTKVKKGFIFSGAVKEIQEHGCIIESGINGLQAFLSADNSSRQLTVGELVNLKIDKITYGQAQSISVCKEVKFENMRIKDSVDALLDYILPGSIVQLTIKKHMKDGLQGSIMNDTFKAYVNEHHLGGTDQNEFKLETTVRARVLYVMPLTKLVYLTLNFAQNTQLGMQPIYKRGDIIEQASVSRVNAKGVLMVLDADHKALISYKSIKSHFKGNYDKDELLARYSKNSKHKLRVLNYNAMDQLYVCTDDMQIVEEKYFCLDDITAGDFVQTTVVKYNEQIGGYDLSLGKLKAKVEALYLSSTSKGLPAGSKLRCRVVSCNAERGLVYVTNRAEYMNKNSQMLTSYKQATKNSIYLGTIVKQDANFMLVRFLNNIKGLLPQSEINNAEKFQTFYVGYTGLFSINERDGEKIILGMPNCLFEVGGLYDTKVLNQMEMGLEVAVAKSDKENETESEIAEELKGLIPLHMLSDFTDLCLAKLNLFDADTELRAVCLNRNIFSVRDVKYYEEYHDTAVWPKVRINDVLKAVVKSVDNEIVELMLHLRNYNKVVRIHWQMLIMEALKREKIMLSPEQVVYCRVLGKDKFTESLSVSAKLTDVWNGELSETADYIKSYLDEVADIRKSLKKEKKKFGKLKSGAKMVAIFEYVHETNGDWIYKLDGTEIIAVMRKSMLGKWNPPEIGSKHECVVLWIDYSSEIVFISSKKADNEHIAKSQGIPENLKGKVGVQAKVLLKLDTIFICSLKKSNNPLVFCPIRLHFNDFECTASAGIEEGSFCRLAFIHDTLPIAVLENCYKLWQSVNLKRKAEEKLITTNSKRVKESRESKVLNENPKKPNQEKIQFFEDKQPNIIEDDAIDEHIEIVNTKNIYPTQVNENKLPGISEFWSADLTALQANSFNVVESDDEMSNEEINITQKRKLTANEKFKQQQAEEQRLRKIEEKYADPLQMPESVDEFDRLVLAEPNDSKNWIKYMVYHLQLAEIDKARSVARRGLKALSFRQTEELLNIWVAFLNLELRYGTTDSFKSILQEALTYNEPLQLYLRVIKLLSSNDCDKQKELLDIIETALRKFKTEMQVWITAANAYFSIGQVERAQQLLSKALKCLNVRDHINTIVAFANMNHKYDEKELAYTLLDQIVTSYPKRVDVWTQYVDVLIKDQQIDSARTVLERAISEKLVLKKMRTIFKKYIQFEESFGTEESVEKVRQLAMEYIKHKATP